MVRTGHGGRIDRAHASYEECMIFDKLAPKTIYPRHATQPTIKLQHQPQLPLYRHTHQQNLTHVTIYLFIIIKTKIICRIK